MSKFQIDAKVQMAIAVFVGALGFLASSALPSTVNPDTAKMIHDWSAWFNQFYILVITPVMLAYTNSAPGPLAPQDPPAVVAAQQKADAVITKDASDVKPEAK